MPGYGRDFAGQLRGTWDRLTHHPDDAGPRRQRPMEATGPGGEGYFLSHDMVRHADYTIDYRDRGPDDAYGRRDPGGGMAQFGRAGAGRGYGGDYRTGRGGYDSGEFFVNRGGAGGTGYHPGYTRDVGMRGGMAAGARGYGADYSRRDSPARYDGVYRGGYPDWSSRGYEDGRHDRTPPPHRRGR